MVRRSLDDSAPAKPTGTAAAMRAGDLPFDLHLPKWADLVSDLAAG